MAATGPLEPQAPVPGPAPDGSSPTPSHAEKLPTLWRNRDYMLLSSYSLLHLSGRHHGSCLAAISGCPLIGLTANTHKMEGDFELLNWPLPVFDFHKISENLEDITKTVIKVIKNNNYYRNLIRKNVDNIKNDVIKNVEIVLAN